MATTADQDLFEPASAQVPSNRQLLFARYLVAILIYVVVLNLFVEYSQYVVIDSFTISLFCAVVLAILLKLTIALEHRVAAFFKAKPGGLAKFMRFFCAWLVLFGSKFVILEALDVVFGHDVDFGGPLNGLVALIVVIVAMLVAEEAIVRFVRRLA
jgi:hypothetical protein